MVTSYGYNSGYRSRVRVQMVNGAAPVIGPGTHHLIVGVSSAAGSDDSGNPMCVGGYVCV